MVKKLKSSYKGTNVKTCGKKYSTTLGNLKRKV
jgi:hypothetical protein